MKFSKVLVTGAAGFIGRNLIEKLLFRGFDVAAAARRFPEPFDGGSIRAVDGNMAPDRDWAEILKDVHIVVHLAARTHVMTDKAADPLAEFRRVNVNGTLNLAEQSVAAGVERFIFISSVGVNGNESIRPFSESDQPDPKDPYTVSKLEAEQGLLELAQDTGFELVIVRPPLVYGPGAPGNFGRLVRLVRRQIPLPLGAVCNRRSLVALDNLVDFIVLCLEHPKAAGQTFLISDDEDVSTPELLEKMARAFGKRILFVPVPVNLIRTVAGVMGRERVADGLLGSLQIDCSKAKNLLGWKPPVSMDEQLEKIAGACLK